MKSKNPTLSSKRGVFINQPKTKYYENIVKINFFLFKILFIQKINRN